MQFMFSACGRIPAHRRAVAAVAALVALFSGAVLVPRAVAQPEGLSRDAVYSEYLVGVFKYASGEVLESVDHLEFAWRMSGHDPAAGMKLAESYYLLKNFTRCEMVLDEVLASDETHRDALMLKAKVRYIKRDRRASVACLERVREHHPRSFETERLLGNIYYEMGDTDNAIEAYQHCLQIDSSYPYIQYRYGRLLRNVGRVDDAEKAFERAVTLDDEFVEPTIELAEIYMESGRADLAVPLLERAVALEAHNEDALMMLVRVHAETGRSDEAIRLLEGRRRANRLSRDGELFLGRLYFDAERFDDAVVLFKDVFEKEPGSAELARILAEVSLNAGDADGARVYFERAISIGPRDYRNYLGLFFAGSPRFTTSVEPIPLDADEKELLLDEASKLVAERDFDGNYMLGIALLSEENLEAAERHLMRAYQVRPDDYNVLLNLANVYEKTRRFDAAEEKLAELYRLAPDDPTVLNFYGYVLSEVGRDLDRAEEMVRKALEKDPDNGYFLDSLGWIHYQKGDYGRAAVELEQANERVQDDPVILEHLGDAYRALRRFAEARAAYERSNRLAGWQ